MAFVLGNVILVLVLSLMARGSAYRRNRTEATMPIAMPTASIARAARIRLLRSANHAAAPPTSGRISVGNHQNSHPRDDGPSAAEGVVPVGHAGARAAVGKETSSS